MEAWWGRRYDRAALTALYGGLDARPLQATLERGKAHEQAVALATLGDGARDGGGPAVARQLVNPFPLVRYYARRALEALRGQDCAVDLDRPTPEIAAAVRACVPEAFPARPAALPAERRTRSGDSDEDRRGLNARQSTDGPCPKPNRQAVAGFAHRVPRGGQDDHAEPRARARSIAGASA